MEKAASFSDNLEETSLYREIVGGTYEKLAEDYSEMASEKEIEDARKKKNLKTVGALVVPTTAMHLGSKIPIANRAVQEGYKRFLNVNDQAAYDAFKKDYKINNELKESINSIKNSDKGLKFKKPDKLKKIIEKVVNTAVANSDLAINDNFTTPIKKTFINPKKMTPPSDLIKKIYTEAGKPEPPSKMKRSAGNSLEGTIFSAALFAGLPVIANNIKAKKAKKALVQRQVEQEPEQEQKSASEYYTKFFKEADSQSMTYPPYGDEGTVTKDNAEDTEETRYTKDGDNEKLTPEEIVKAIFNKNNF